LFKDGSSLKPPQNLKHRWRLRVSTSVIVYFAKKPLKFVESTRGPTTSHPATLPWPLDPSLLSLLSPPPPPPPPLHLHTACANSTQPLLKMEATWPDGPPPPARHHRCSAPTCSLLPRNLYTASLPSLEHGSCGASAARRSAWIRARFLAPVSPLIREGEQHPTSPATTSVTASPLLPLLSPRQWSTSSHLQA